MFQFLSNHFGCLSSFVDRDGAHEHMDDTYSVFPVVVGGPFARRIRRRSCAYDLVSLVVNLGRIAGEHGPHVQ